MTQSYETCHVRWHVTLMTDYNPNNTERYYFMSLWSESGQDQVQDNTSCCVISLLSCNPRRLHSQRRSVYPQCWSVLEQGDDPITFWQWNKLHFYVLKWLMFLCLGDTVKFITMLYTSFKFRWSTYIPQPHDNRIQKNVIILNQNVCVKS